MGFEGANDVVGTDVDVVVAEDAKALGSLEGGEDFGGDASSVPGDFKGEGAATDVVAGDEDEVRVEPIHLGDHALEEGGLGVLLEVDVAHLDDAKVDEGVGEVADGNGLAGDAVLVAGVGSGVGGEAKAGDGEGGTEEAAAGYVMDLRMAVGLGTTVHIP